MLLFSHRNFYSKKILQKGGVWWNDIDNIFFDFQNVMTNSIHL